MRPHPAGKYWQQPGRSIVEALLTPFPLPSPSADSSFDPSSFHRSFFLRPNGPPPPLSLPQTLDPPLPSATGESATYTLRPAPPRSGKEADAPLTVAITRDVLLTRKWTLSELEGYLRTWSSAHAYNEAHRPSSSSSAVQTGTQLSNSDQEGDANQPYRDCVEVFLERLKREGIEEVERRDGGLDVGWEMGVVFGRKRA